MECKSIQEVMTAQVHKLGVSYSRGRSIDEREGYSISDQQRLIREYADDNKIKVVQEFAEFTDQRQVTGRPAFLGMVSFLQKHPEVTIILSQSCDRLARNFEDFCLIEALNRELHLIREGEILSKQSAPSRNFVYGIMALGGTPSVNTLSVNVRRGLRGRAMAGIWPSLAPIGYLNVQFSPQQRGIAPDPERAQLVAQCFTLFATKQYSLGAIAKWAHSAGLRFRNNGRTVGPRAVRAILQNRIYSGDLEWEGTLYAGKHEPLISREVWNQVQSILNARKRPRLPRGGSEEQIQQRR